MIKASLLLVLSIGTFSASLARAATPECLANGHALAVNDSDVEQWEDSAANQFHSRAHVQGTIIQIFPDQTGHRHFSVQIGATAEDAVEVIYNQSFGALPSLVVGAKVEACGDYINDRSSPDKAILHWVHKSDTPAHPSGYVAIDGRVYGGE